jgi:hypothetical protein
MLQVNCDDPVQFADMPAALHSDLICQAHMLEARAYLNDLIWFMDFAGQL